MLRRRIIKALHRLTTVTLEPTNDCNLNCCYCPRTKRDVGYMDFNLFRRLVHELPEKTRVALSYGGESILHPRFHEMAEMCRAEFGDVSVTTNNTVSYPSYVHVRVGQKPPPVVFTYDQKFADGVPEGWKPRYTFCLAPYYSMVVLWNGDVTVCCHDVAGHRVLDSVKGKTLWQVWNAEAYRDLRKKGHCDGCELYKYYGK